MKENTGKTKYVLLGLMAKEPQTGYTIKKSIEYEYSHFWQESYGQIYPTLKALVKEGLAESVESQELKNGRGQILYKITEAGKKELKNWLSEEPTIEKLRYEILLKVSFGASTEPEIILGHLDEFIKRNDRSIKEMDGFLDFFKGMSNKSDRHLDSELTAICGKYFYTAMKEWAMEAEQIIKDRMGEKG
ncbi:PadR family transcriptional regulator [Clostridium aminobutyricum]|uniref:PadR family transcriptional regulator n=1 Tax=Clostridium aminobutyricum TaxID=33953 RepID=A0A939D655_CLOAM|nr:PadR family transcriptional regulator [Clostridium aminobutyricum]MBN7771755.1 PadR family transcriptional regulator [Clostridium aminobutyricum]